MKSRTKEITFKLTERQAELTAIALLEAVCEIQDDPEKEYMNNSEEQQDRLVAYEIISSLLPRGI